MQEIVSSRGVSRRREECPPVWYMSISYLVSLIYRGEFPVRKGTNLHSSIVSSFLPAFGGFCGRLGQNRGISPQRTQCGRRSERSCAGVGRVRCDVLRPLSCRRLLPAANQRRRLATELSLFGSWRHSS